jgi:hypothetical protein
MNDINVNSCVVKPGVELDLSLVWESTAGYMKASVMEQRSDEEPCPLKSVCIITPHPSEVGTAAAAANHT